MNAAKIIVMAALAFPLVLLADPYLLNDNFSDGNRSNQSLPDSAAWFATSTSTTAEVTLKDGKYQLEVGGFGLTTDTPRGAAAYFAPAASPASLTAENNFIRLSMTLSFEGPIGSLATAVRFALLESGDTRISTDTLGSVTAVGYGFIFDPGSGVLLFRSRPDTKGPGNYISTFGNYDPMGSSSLFPVVPGVTYNLTIDLERQADGSVKITATLSDGTTTARESYVDNEFKYYNFDTVVMATRPQYTRAMFVDNIRVSLGKKPTFRLSIINSD